jgi:hypothetical protein
MGFLPQRQRQSSAPIQTLHCTSIAIHRHSYRWGRMSGRETKRRYIYLSLTSQLGIYKTVYDVYLCNLDFAVPRRDLLNGPCRLRFGRLHKLGLDFSHWLPPRRLIGQVRPLGLNRRHYALTCANHSTSFSTRVRLDVVYLRRSSRLDLRNTTPRSRRQCSPTASRSHSTRVDKYRNMLSLAG